VILYFFAGMKNPVASHGVLHSPDIPEAKNLFLKQGPPSLFLIALYFRYPHLKVAKK